MAERTDRRAARVVSPEDELLPQPGALRRKVTASGVIWLHGRAYYVSRQLAGQVIPVEIEDGRLVIDVMIPLHKEYRLPE